MSAVQQPHAFSEKRRGLRPGWTETVDLPTPPLPLATAMTFFTLRGLSASTIGCRRAPGSSTNAGRGGAAGSPAGCGRSGLRAAGRDPQIRHRPARAAQGPWAAWSSEVSTTWATSTPSASASTSSGLVADPGG